MQLNFAYQCMHEKYHYVHDAYIIILFILVYPVHVSSREIFERNGIAVTLEWMGGTRGVMYSVYSLPQLQVPITVENMVAELRLSYNVVYNVSIVATLCGQRSLLNTVHLHYGELSLSLISRLLFKALSSHNYAVKCSHPLNQEMTDDSVQILVDRHLFLEGTNVTFICPPGWTLSGPNTSSCVGKEWKPDPIEAKCICELRKS